MANNGVTVNQLKKICARLVKSGFGDKVVLLSDDDECNGFHTAWDGIISDTAEIGKFADVCGFHDGNKPEDVVLFV